MTEQVCQALEQPIGLPRTIRDNYGISDNVVVEKLSGGRVNDTVLIVDNGERSILRRLSGILHEDVIEDMQVIGSHLVANSWEAPVNMPTLSGANYLRDDSGSVWHRMHYIDSDGKTSPASLELADTAGGMLGAWHQTMQQLNYVPRFSLPHFHDTPHYAKKLHSELPILPDQSAQLLGRTLLKHYAELPPQLAEPQQLIHGDPKLDNMLFREGTPFTLVDFDTIMRGSRWLDIGDFLRSLNSKLLCQDSVVESTESFMAGYSKSAELLLSDDEALHYARQATGRIALELGMRYLSDIVDSQEYFSWDPRYGNRLNHHLERAEVQLQVANKALQGI